MNASSPIVGVWSPMSAQADNWPSGPPDANSFAPGQSPQALRQRHRWTHCLLCPRRRTRGRQAHQTRIHSPPGHRPWSIAPGVASTAQVDALPSLSAQADNWPSGPPDANSFAPGRRPWSIAPGVTAKAQVKASSPMSAQADNWPSGPPDANSFAPWATPLVNRHASLGDRCEAQ